MLEMEAAYYDFDANIKCQEEMIAFTVKRILERCQAELKDLDRDPKKLEAATETPFPRLRYGDAIEHINAARIAKGGGDAEDQRGGSRGEAVQRGRRKL